jgi:hypothetical protein
MAQRARSRHSAPQRRPAQGGVCGAMTETHKLAAIHGRGRGPRRENRARAARGADDESGQVDRLSTRPFSRFERRLSAPGSKPVFILARVLRPTLTIRWEPCGRYGRPKFARLIERGRREAKLAVQDGIARSYVSGSKLDRPAWQAADVTLTITTSSVTVICTPTKAGKKGGNHVYCREHFLRASR